MLNICKKHPVLTAAVLGALSITSALAGEVTTSKEVAPVEPPKKVVSGTLSLQANTHFISYGSDVWGAGANWNDTLFNPSLELGIELGSGFKLITGTWWDVNDNAESSIGNRVQEVDVWGGLGYTLDKLSFTLLYQAWMYGSDIEHIVDLKVSYDTFLHPYVLVHGRPDAGASGGEEGAVFLLGFSEGFNAGPVAFNFPVSVAFMTDGYQGKQIAATPGTPGFPAQFGIPAVDPTPGTPGSEEADAGFGFASAGINISVPVPFLPGEWTFGVGGTYYHTNDDVIPKNRAGDFVTGSAGLTLTF